MGTSLASILPSLRMKEHHLSGTQLFAKRQALKGEKGRVGGGPWRHHAGDIGAAATAQGRGLAALEVL